MTSTSYSRGHQIEFDGKKWIYSDTKESIDNQRPCIRCGRPSTKDGHDACIGNITGATSACCGHGVSERIVILSDTK